MNTQHEKLTALAVCIVDHYGKAFADPDCQIDGGDAVDSLQQYVELAQDALKPEAPRPVARKPKMKHFDGLTETVDYLASEIVATLEDDYGKMCDDERKHYSTDDRREMSRKLHDVRLVADLLPGMLETLTTLAGMTTEEEYGEDAPPSEDWITTLSEMILSAREAIGQKGR